MKWKFLIFKGFWHNYLCRFTSKITFWRRWSFVDEFINSVLPHQRVLRPLLEIKATLRIIWISTIIKKTLTFVRVSFWGCCYLPATLYMINLWVFLRLMYLMHCKCSELIYRQTKVFICCFNIKLTILRFFKKCCIKKFQNHRQIFVVWTQSNHFSANSATKFT